DPARPRRPVADDPHPGPHGRDHAAGHPDDARADAHARAGADDRGDRRRAVPGSADGDHGRAGRGSAPIWSLPHLARDARRRGGRHGARSADRGPERASAGRGRHGAAPQGAGLPGARQPRGPRGARPPAAVRPRRRPAADARGGRQEVRPHARADPPDRVARAAQAAPPLAEPEAPGVRDRLTSAQGTTSNAVPLRVGGVLRSGGLGVRRYRDPPLAAWLRPPAERGAGAAWRNGVPLLSWVFGWIGWTPLSWGALFGPLFVPL